MTLTRYKREAATAAAYVVMLAGIAVVAPSFFTAHNLRDLAMNNLPLLLVAVGMTLVILVGEIDISVASQFALCSVLLGVLSREGLPVLALIPVAMVIGALLGAVNGALVGLFGLPSIIVTLALFVTWRDGLRLATEGAWIQGLSDDFQWFGLPQTTAQWVMGLATVAIVAGCGWGLRRLRAGRAVYAVGSNAEAARLAGIAPGRVVFFVFVAIGALTGLAALLNAVRFSAIPSNAGAGLELKAIAAVVVGGAAITGGRGSLAGTVIGVMLLGTIGPALVFVGINPFWEKAIQGGIILVALASDAVVRRLEQHVRPLNSDRVVVRSR